MRSAFHKISRVGSLTGATKWYLSEDCLLAAKRVMYAVEYRRFYLRDLESIVVWPSRTWLLRPIIPGVLFVALGAAAVALGEFHGWRDRLRRGRGVGGVGTGARADGAGRAFARQGRRVDLPIVKRTRRARKVLAKIDAAVRATRGGVMEQPTAPVAGPQPAKPPNQTKPESVPAAAPIGDLT